MKYIAEIDIMPLKALLDPQGKAVTSGLKNLGMNSIDNVRIGRHITMEVNASSKEDANKQVTTACEKLLANKIMESYRFEIEEG